MPRTIDAPDITPRRATDDLHAAASAAQGEGKREYVQRMFSDIAPRYDLLNHVLSMNIDKRWRQKALTALAWTATPGGTYLDLCAGTLDVGALLVKQPGFGGFVAGADFAVPMLQHGTGKAPRSVLAPVGADALLLPFGNASLDGAIVAFGIRNVPISTQGCGKCAGSSGPAPVSSFSNSPRLALRSCVRRISRTSITCCPSSAAS